MNSYQPTRILIVRESVRGTAGHDRLLLNAIEAASSFGDQFRVAVEFDWIREEFPAVADRLESTFTSADRPNHVVYHAPVSPDSLETIESLLEMTGGPRVYGIRSVELHGDGACRLRYVPEHQLFTLDDTTADGIATAVADVIADEPAVLLPKRSLVEWTTDGTNYQISPPYLCVGRTCYRLSRLTDIEVDRARRSIEFFWDSAETGAIGQTLGWMADHLGLSRPQTLTVDAAETFEAVVDALEQVCSGMETDERER